MLANLNIFHNFTSIMSMWQHFNINVEIFKNIKTLVRLCNQQKELLLWDIQGYIKPVRHCYLIIKIICF